MTHTKLLFAAAVAVSACGGPGARDIVTMDEVPGGSGSPKIARVTDLGDLAALPPSGALPKPDSDERFGIGELILIEGDNFGKLPAVKVGGAPFEIVARTGNGGIVGHIPAGIDAGAAEVVVSHTSGRDATSIAVERYAVLVDRAAGQAHILALEGVDRVAVRASLAIPGAVAAAFGPGGGVAYIAANPPGASATVHVIALTASGGPKQLLQRHLPISNVSDIATSLQAPIGAAVGSGKLVLLDLSVPRGPSPGTPFPLVGDARSVAIHPKGKRAVILSPLDNHLTPVDLSRPNEPKVEQPVDLLPGEREPMAADAQFAPGGDEVWALVGDGQESLAGGSTHPTRLVVVSWETGSPRVLRTAEIAAAGAPIGIAVGLSESVASAAAIRSTRRRAPIVVAAVNRKIYSQEPEDAPSKLSDLGQLISADLDGKAQMLAAETSLFADPVVTHDLTGVVSPTVRLAKHEGGTRFELGITFQPLPGAPGAARFAPLGPATPATLKTPPRFALAP
jgi:hypothetical protein